MEVVRFIMNFKFVFICIMYFSLRVFAVSQPVLLNLPVDDVRTALTGIWQHGLNPKVYWTAEIEQAYVSHNLTPEVTGQIYNNFEKALNDVSIGILDPSSVASDIKIKRKKGIDAALILQLAQQSQMNATVMLDFAAPQTPHYKSLQIAMKRLFPIYQQGGWSRINPSAKVLSLGVSDSVVPQMKKRLQVMGYQIANPTSSVVDSQMVQIINEILELYKIKPDGSISPKSRSWNYFYAFCGDKIRQIQADMEKLRWLPQKFEDRYIFVNTAFTTFTLEDKIKNLSMNFRTVNGSVERKTPTMIDRIAYLVFNPTWTVPPTVFLNDKVQLIKNLDHEGIRKYFSDNFFRVLAPDFKTEYDPTTINWKGINSAAVNFYIQQKPNYMNALGVVKFMLTNPYAIYLHDTNRRDLFQEAARLQSSGCIRLEKPLDLAEYLLADLPYWSRSQIENFVVKPGQVLDKETTVNLKKTLPVYLMPLTSQLNSDGVLRQTIDTYNHNQSILNQMKNGGFTL